MPKNYKPIVAPEITFTRMEENNSKPTLSLGKYPNATIITCLKNAIDLEEYEEAAIYRDELKRRIQ